MLINKIFLTGLASIVIFSTTLPAFGFPNTNDTKVCKPATMSNENAINSNLNSYILLNNNALSQSVNLLNVAKTLEKMESVNKNYIHLMLELSDDIGEMADRINVMADKILIMANNIDSMADKLLVTQEIQSKNLEMIQSNLQESQIILSNLLNK